MTLAVQRFFRGAAFLGAAFFGVVFFGAAFLTVVFLAGGLAEEMDDAFGGAPVYGHDWYPFECCARNDCVPAKAIEADDRGGVTVIVGDLRIPIPKGFAPRMSLDSRVHVCFRMYPDEMDGNILITPVCLFLPPQA